MDFDVLLGQDGSPPASRMLGWERAAQAEPSEATLCRRGQERAAQAEPSEATLCRRGRADMMGPLAVLWASALTSAQSDSLQPREGATGEMNAWNARGSQEVCHCGRAHCTEGPA